ncbi:multidrug effflux MFS transporter [Knoellia sp. p5-6-4]|uniref:multidrug effflux MFS transporter n=1 Tax=unclassified Knoellia TaxID=2618719 RepID=UPI0023D990D1|nr:multidrug effflux MFS transporter [Knoellia sp. p5-6-4]MDF2146113.1 multidrug effflux MFS transporter [Knoellia sp. p5-6-4]
MTAPTTELTPGPTDPAQRPSRRGVRRPRPVMLEAPRGRSYVRFVLVLGALIAIGPLTIDTYLPAMPSIADELGATESQVQGTLTGILLGLGLGQLLVGPLADAVGRRKPLIAGLVLHIVASVACAFAPTVELLTAARVVQGLGNAAVSVVAMATVRDLFTGSAAATLLSRLMLVMGIAPIVAPTIGGAVLAHTSWRGVFGLVSLAGVVLVTVASLLLRETLPPERRRRLEPLPVLRTYASLLRDRTFVGLVLISGLMFATLFSYIGGSSFVLQEIYGLSVAQFGLAFGLNSLGFLTGSQLNPLLLRRLGPRDIVRAGVGIGAVSALVLLAAAVTGVGGLPLVLGPLWFLLFACGLTLPNTPALALTRHGEAAGTAAALLGASQFVIGGAAAPVIGALGSGSAVPMALVMATTATGAAVVAALTLRVSVLED